MATESEEQKRIKQALKVAFQFGGVDGAHHKTWVIDQMVRALTGCTEGKKTQEYGKFVFDAKNGEDGPNTYDYDEGIAP